MEKELFVVTFVTNYSNNFTTLQYLNDNSKVSSEVMHLQKYRYTKSGVHMCMCGGGRRGGQEPNKQP